MKKNILITWWSNWIWKYLVKNLKLDNDILSISRNKTWEKWVEDFNINLTNTELFNNFVKKCEQDKKVFDCIIINAWVWYFWKYEEWTDNEYINIINLNLLSPILFIKAIEKFLSPKVKIVFIWSIIGKKFMKGAAVYQASKFWLRWFAWALKQEMKWKKIHIINPKIVDTTFHDNSKEKLIFSEKQYTTLDSILMTVHNIIEWNENRFEIDL